MRNVAFTDSGLVIDLVAIHADGVGAAAVSDDHRPIGKLLDDCVEAGDAEVVEDEVVGVAATYRDHRLGDLQDAAFSFRR
jgi:hypothetical protein